MLKKYSIFSVAVLQRLSIITFIELITYCKEQYYYYSSSRPEGHLAAVCLGMAVAR
jgi:hypothetical protein